MKAALALAYPDAKAGAIPVWAGILVRFAFQMQQADLVVAPHRPDSTLNFGVVDGEYEYVPGVARHPHRRNVKWFRTGVSRGIFPQEALYEIGSAMTLFQIRNHTEVFRRYLDSHSDQTFTETTAAAESQGEVVESWAEAEPSAARIDQFTHDFVLKRLLTDLDHEDFEYFTADLLRAIGYQARVLPTLPMAASTCLHTRPARARAAADKDSMQTHC